MCEMVHQLYQHLTQIAIFLTFTEVNLKPHAGLGVKQNKLPEEVG